MSGELPNKLSALLRLAVADAQKCEADPRYMLNMATWHVPEGDVCQVCMAGAVMAQTLHTPIDKQVTWSHASSIDPKMHAVNDMREGDFVSAAEVLMVKLTPEQNRAVRHARALVCAFYDAGEESDYVPHETRPEDYYGRADWETYLECADILEGVGL